MQIYLVLLACCTIIFGAQCFDTTEIHGYHFHTYYFQTNKVSSNEAIRFRTAIQDQIDSGFLKNCRLNHLNLGPLGPHPIGSFETCCNKTSISEALSWFMLNRGNLSILLHPLTRYELTDHTSRRMFLGDSLFLDLSVLAHDLHDEVDLCLPLDKDPGSKEVITPTTVVREGPSTRGIGLFGFYLWTVLCGSIVCVILFAKIYFKHALPLLLLLQRKLGPV